MLTTAVNATGDGMPNKSTVISAGDVRIAATTAAKMTPLTGTLALLSFDQCRAPGTAPSRLNAYNMRVQLVMQATEQKNCPTVAIARTKLGQFGESAWLKMMFTKPPPAVTSSTF